MNLIPDISNQIPGHLGIIMDGNGRWARMRGLDVAQGHRSGARRVKDIINCCDEIGVQYVSLYAFSTENWLRPKEEVNALMNLLVLFLKKEINEFNSKNCRIMFAGRREKFSKKVLNTINYSENLTKDNTGLTMILCVDYGGRQEISDAANKIEGEVNPDKLSSNLYLPGIPDVDFLIRTSGEERISNFMLGRVA
jgi:undecaprenyl diphosphate synthase